MMAASGIGRRMRCPPLILRPRPDVGLQEGLSNTTMWSA